MATASNRNKKTAPRQKPEDLEIEIVYVPIGDLKPAAYNPRTISDAALERLERGIRKFGLVDPIVCNSRRNRKNVVIGGHQRLTVAQRIGMEKVPVTYVNLDANAEKALNIALNNPELQGDYDRPKLAAILKELEAAKTDITLTGYDEGQVAKLLESIAEERRSGDEPAAKPKNPITHLGDLYQIGDHRLLCGDATNPEHVERLMAGRRAHLVFTDPPYGVDYDGSKNKEWEPIAGDDLRGDELIAFIAAALKNTIAAANDNAAYYIWHSPKTRRDFDRALDLAGLEEIDYIIWAKNNFVQSWGKYQGQFEPCYFAQRQGAMTVWTGRRDEITVWRLAHEIEAKHVAAALGTGIRIAATDGTEIFVAPRAPKNKQLRRLRLDKGETITITTSDDDSDVWEIKKDTITEYQVPTQKPAALAERAMRNSSEAGNIVLDVFAGSGSTLEAAHNTGRTAYLMELDAGVCDIITARAEKLGLEVHLAEPAAAE